MLFFGRFCITSVDSMNEGRPAAAVGEAWRWQSRLPAGGAAAARSYDAARRTQMEPTDRFDFTMIVSKSNGWPRDMGRAVGLGLNLTY
jgi:hypothetical protein